MDKNKYFIITIDTEEDNQWDFNQVCSTNNARYLPRFQELAEKYKFKPVWLTTYGMANNDFFVDYFKKKQEENLCEIGMHLHAWNNPPEYDIKNNNKERSYLIEYPYEIMEAKIKSIDLLLTQKFGIKPVTHRAGRWTTSNDYFDLLIKNGYKVDCSVTPNIDWSKHPGQSGIGGSNYMNFPQHEYFINNSSLLEVPVTIQKIRLIEKEKMCSIKKTIIEIIYMVLGKKQWIRPDSTFSIRGIEKVIDICNMNNKYIMFMLHSSELMPGGSPNFKSEADIEKLYTVIESIFQYATKLGYTGITLKDYYEKNFGGENIGRK